MNCKLEFCKEFIKAVNGIRIEFGISEELAIRAVEMNIKLNSGSLYDEEKDTEKIAIRELQKINAICWEDE